MDLPSWVPFFGSKPITQEVLLFTEDACILKLSVPIVRGYLVDDAQSGNKSAFSNIGSGFILDNEALIRSRKTGISYLPLSILSNVPLYLADVDNVKSKAKAKEVKEAMSSIAVEALEEELDNVNKENAKEKWSSTLRFVILLMAILFVIMIIAGLAMSGKVHMPNLGG